MNFLDKWKLMKLRFKLSSKLKKFNVRRNDYFLNSSKIDLHIFIF